MKKFSKFIVFCIVGGLAFLIDISFFNLFLIFNIGFIFSRSMAILISMVFNFNANRNVTFSARDGKIHRQVGKYLVVYACSFLANLITGVTIVTIFGETVLVSNIAAISGIIVQIPVSYFGLLLWAFR